MRKERNPFHLQPFGIQQNMDKMLSVHQKKKAKKPSSKSKKKPVKIVYISNPMKVKVSASQFRALVQELTGQDADMPDPTKYSDSTDDGPSVGGGGGEVSADESKAVAEEGQQVQRRPRNEVVPKGSDHNNTTCETCDEDEDVLFDPQMMESFPGLVASNLWYQSNHFDDHLNSLDLM